MRMTNLLKMKEILSFKKKKRRDLSKYKSKLKGKMILSVSWGPSVGLARYEEILHGLWREPPKPKPKDKSPSTNEADSGSDPLQSGPPPSESGPLQSGLLQSELGPLQSGPLPSESGPLQSEPLQSESGLLQSENSIADWLEKFPRLKVALRRFMPSRLSCCDEKDRWTTHYDFWEAEWRKHGPKVGAESPIVYFRTMLSLFSRIPQTSALGLGPGAHIRVKDLRELVYTKVNARPEVKASKRTKVLSREFVRLRFELEELRYYMVGQQFKDSPQPWAGHLRTELESMCLHEQPIKLKHVRKSKQERDKKRLSAITEKSIAAKEKIWGLEEADGQ